MALLLAEGGCTLLHLRHHEDPREAAAAVGTVEARASCAVGLQVDGQAGHYGEEVGTH